jgi:hypothetical protein
MFIAPMVRLARNSSKRFLALLGNFLGKFWGDRRFCARGPAERTDTLRFARGQAPGRPLRHAICDRDDVLGAGDVGTNRREIPFVRPGGLRVTPVLTDRLQNLRVLRADAGGAGREAGTPRLNARATGKGGGTPRLNARATGGEGARRGKERSPSPRGRTPLLFRVVRS